MTVRFADADGFADLNVVKLLINRSLDEVSACSLVYDNQTDRVSLAGDTGGDQTGATAGATATLQNSQCSLDVSGVSVFRYGQTLELKFPLTFKASFSGNHIVYLAARDAQGGDSDWQPSGVVDLDDAAGPSVIALTPNESDGTVQTLTVAYRHGSASSDGARISRGQVLVNQVSDPRGACYVDYDTAENDLFLVADDGEALLPSVQPARNGVPGGGESQNSQCAIDGAKSSVVDVGQHLYLSVHMTFKSGFEGRKIVYAAAQTGADFDTDWQAVGTTVTADRPLDIEFIPRDAEHDVPTNHRVLVSFPEPINPSGMDASSVQLFVDGSTSVAAAAVVSDDGFFVSLRPAADLDPDSDYRAVLNGLRYQSGMAVPNEATYFRTGQGPSVGGHAGFFGSNIGQGSSNRSPAPRNAQYLAKFAEPVDPTSFGAALASHNFGPTSGQVQFSRALTSVRFIADEPYPVSEDISVVLGAETLTGEPVGGLPSFLTSFDSNLAAPEVLHTGVDFGTASTDRAFQVSFSPEVDSFLFDDGPVRILCEGRPVSLADERDEDHINRALFRLAGSDQEDCALIVEGLRSVTGVEQADAYAVGFQLGQTDREPPAIVSRRPFLRATQVPLDIAVEILFSEPVVPDGNRVMRASNGQLFEHSFDPSRRVLTLTPAGLLRPNTV